jgi:hypothetical protein
MAVVVCSSSVHSPTSRGGPAPLSAALRRVVTRPPPLLPLRRLPLLLLAVVLRCATAVANNVMPPAPHDWVYLEHHSVGNPADCGSPSAKCHNLDPPEQLAQLSCPKSPGAAKCIEEATKACDEHATCIAFAFCNVGSEDRTGSSSRGCSRDPAPPSHSRAASSGPSLPALGLLDPASALPPARLACRRMVALRRGCSICVAEYAAPPADPTDPDTTMESEEGSDESDAGSEEKAKEALQL